MLLSICCHAETTQNTPNPVDDTGLTAPDDNTVDAFQRVLREAGIDTFLRRRRGDDIAAARGQLASHGAERKVRSSFVPS
jgi:adenine C2-methylase RlmN of 23S rRNA A2503 and tRNA A37